MTQALLRLGLAATASVALGRALASPRPGTLELELVLLPLLLWAWGEVAADARRRIGAAAEPPRAGLELLAAALLVLLTLWTPRLGLAHVEAALVAAWLLLAGVWVGRRSRIWLELLRRFRRAAPLHLLLLPLGLYLILLPWQAGHRLPDGDEPYFLLLADSLVHDLDVDLANQYEEHRSLRFMDRVIGREWADPPPTASGAQYSRHTLLLPLLLAPAFGLAGKWGALVVMALLAALAAWLTATLAVRLRMTPRAVLGAWLLVAFTAPWLVYSYQVWVEIPGAVLLCVGLLTVLGEPEGDRATRRRRWLAVAAVAVLLLLLKHRFVPLAGSLLLIAWWRWGRRPRELLLLAIGAVTAVAGWLALNAELLGSPLRDHPWPVLLRILTEGPAVYARGLVGIWFDACFGLLAVAPIWLLSLAGVARAGRERRDLLATLAVVGLPYLLLVAPRLEWYGAWAPPFRFGIVLLPLVAVVTALAVERPLTPIRRLVVMALAAVSLLMAITYVATPSWAYHLADGGSHPTDVLGARLGADVGRLAPSYVRLRAASWVVPPAATALLLLLWAGRRARRPLRPVPAAALLLLATAGGGAVAATRLPTRIVELEDSWVVKRGGRLEPEPWTIARPRFDGAWAFAAGDSAEIPIVPGGERVEIHLRWRRDSSLGAARLLLSADGSELARLEPPRAVGWQETRVGPLAWPRAARMELRVEAAGEGVSRGALLVDRLVLDWQARGDRSPGGGPPRRADD